MGLPSISQYVHTVENPDGLFSTLGKFQAERDVYGNLRIRSGNNSVVFKIFDENKNAFALKCYTKNGINRESIYDFISKHTDSLLAKTRLLRSEIYVYDELSSAGYHDVVVSEWLEGNTLETEIRRAAMESGMRRFAELSAGFDRMAVELLGREWAHGDIKPENIVVGKDGRFRLIDYDAMFIPSLAGCSTSETGTQPYQHPARDKNCYDKRIDDYSIALISVSLRALSLNDMLYAMYGRGDNMLYPEDILSGNSTGFDKILKLFAERGDHSSYALAKALVTPVYAIEGIREMIDRDRVVYFANTKPSGLISDLRPDDGTVSEPPRLFERNGRWGYIDSEGRIISEPIFEKAFEFTESLAVVCLEGIWQAIDAKGEVSMRHEGCEVMKPFSEGLAAVKKEGKWGYVNARGEVVIEPAFEMAGSMRFKRAVVKINGKYGFIEPDGTQVITAIYDYATGFMDGKAMVSCGSEVFPIDLAGNRNPA